jgi:hypothetical protein
VKRVIRHQQVDGHAVAIVEIMEEEGPTFVLVTEDGVVINGDQPLLAMPTEVEVRDIFRRWRDTL